MDHIINNENRYLLTPIVVDYEIIDHYPIMLSVSNKLKTSCDDDKLIFKRSFAEFAAVNFNQELHDRLNDFLFRSVTINENIFDRLFNKFHSMITQTIDKYAPSKKLTRKQKRFQHRPWIDKGILVSIKLKQKMHKTDYIKGSTLGKYLYNEYSNMLKRVKKFSLQD